MGQIVDLYCSPEGFLVPPDTWPTCREPKKCTNIPDAPSSSNLKNPHKDPNGITSVLEFQYASYPCKG